MKVWTSGRYSKKCGKYIWCPEKEVFATDIKWQKGYPNTESGICVGAQIGGANPDENGFFNLKCTESFHFLCHVRNDE
jgi:hypothetical protein